MSILAVGISHATAPVEVREQVAIAPEATVAALKELRATDGVDEAAILSTCNRTELYCSIGAGDPGGPGRWLHRYHRLAEHRLEPFLYQHCDAAAVRHMLRVAAGLDSMVVGEPEILGQMKSAYRMAQDAATLSKPLDRLFQHTFAVAKQVRSNTGIGRNPVSVAYAAVTLARRVFAELSELTILLVGAGETMELTARYLSEQRVRHLLVANRTLARAADLAARFRGSAIALDELDANLAKVDLIISSTGAPEPVIRLAPVVAALKRRKRRPIFMIDLAVPRDVEERVGDLEDVYLYTIDDLRAVAEAGQDQRRLEAEKATALIELEVEGFMNWLRSLEAVASIRGYREQALAHSRDLVAAAHRQIQAGKPAEEVVNRLAHALTRRLLHQPTSRLRSAAEEGRRDLLEAASELFALDRDERSSREE